MKIGELKNKKFLIPIYQRNYAWTDVEINQFIDDILRSKEDYYVGTLVVFEKHNQTFEVVDGQQRLTTIQLILLSLRNHFSLQVDFLNLSFEARKENESILKQLEKSDKDKFEKFLSENENNELIYTIKKYIIPKLGEIQNIKEFKERLLNHIIINENVIPENINIHHYFEKMNSTGKQLEFHSVLRAKMMKDVPNGFEVWDECSKMQHYSKFLNSGLADKTLNLKEFIDNINLNEEFVTDTKPNSEVEEYDSIIDFPNFLLIALRIYTDNENVPLNDKELLNQFGYYNSTLVVDPSDFIQFLKEFKILFDKFIIKRSFIDVEPYWAIKNIDTDRNTFSNTDITEEDLSDSNESNSLQIRIVKVQSVLHASYPSNNYKEWLYEILKYVWLNRQSSLINILEFGKSLLEKLESIASSKFQENITENLPTQKGLIIARIVFYYSDYLLWKLYFDNVRGLKKEISGHENLNNLINRIDKNKSLFQTFNFRSFSSIEHLYPQNPGSKNYIDNELLHSFGNLCLISRSSNSKYSNLEPIAKKEHSKNSRLNESLKQAIMFQILEDEKSWKKEQIISHENDMKSLISYYS